MVVLGQPTGLQSQQVALAVGGQQRLLPRVVGIRKRKPSCCLGCYGSMLYTFCSSPDLCKYDILLTLPLLVTNAGWLLFPPSDSSDQ